jgi:hypothetical protein
MCVEKSKINLRRFCNLNINTFRMFLMIATVDGNLGLFVHAWSSRKAAEGR